MVNDSLIIIVIPRQIITGVLIYANARFIGYRGVWIEVYILESG